MAEETVGMPWRVAGSVGKVVDWWLSKSSSQWLLLVAPLEVQHG